MSTRSGKRIHNSFQENIVKSDVEQIDDSVKKRRSRRLKENIEEFSGSIVKNKKRPNYVTYPTDDEIGIDTVDTKDAEGSPVRLLRKNVLKEKNLLTSSVENEPLSEAKKSLRSFRRTRRFGEDAQENIKIPNHSEDVVSNGEIRKTKKEKIKKPAPEQVIEEIVISKKKPKKKKGKKAKRSGSMMVEDIEPKNTSLNRSNMSVDSFHSAAGSPQKDIEILPALSQQKHLVVNTTFEKNDDGKHVKMIEGRRTRSTARLSSLNTSVSTPHTLIKQSRKRKSSTKELDKNTLRNELNENEMDVEVPINNTDKEPLFNKISKKRKSSIMDTVSDCIITETKIKNSTFDCKDYEKIKNATMDLKNTNTSANLDTIQGSNVNTTFDKDNLSLIRKSTDTSIINDENGLDKNTTYDKETIVDEVSAAKTIVRQSVLNTTFEKSINSSHTNETKDSITPKPALINTTFEKETDSKQFDTTKSSINNATFEKDEPTSEIQSNTRNDIENLQKSALSTSSQKQSTEMNSTFDKTEKCDSTFDKDKKLDTTFDNNSDPKLFLISSDNSNVTMDKSDVSRISITSDESKEDIVNMTPVLIESSLDESGMDKNKLSPKTPAQAPVTPLKREGTFTKDGPEAVETPNPKLSKTPTKRMSLPSPGCTPFQIKSVPREKSVLDVTRSIEKKRRSSLSEPLPRSTKVMFCSPVNNPAVVMQQRRKVIKSNLKGSNKSFVFDDNESRPAPRKRSYTQSDADTARAKRKRVADETQHSAHRLSRCRTTSASAKPTEGVTPTKKPSSPKRPEAKISRTKLPNFAALHRREFAKMESLNECQERRARRAKHLLTPTGAVTFLDRTSPRETSSEPQKSPTETKPEQKDSKKEKRPKKPETPVKSLPTLKSLNPGYTRFGFKLNLDVNPFSIPSKAGDKNDSLFNFSNKKESRAKARLFSFSSKKVPNITEPLKEMGKLTRQATLPSMAGTTRREVAKQTVMREKSFTERRNVDRSEIRTVIKGVRTNRRFELQMRMRNLD